MTEASHPRPYHRARRAVGLCLLVAFLALPFLRIGGESALRFDVPSLRLHVFGSTVWMQDFFLVLAAGFALVFAAIFLTIQFGRLWCGWACPQTVLVDLTAFTGRKGAGVATLLFGYAATVLLAAAVSAAAVGYFLSPYDLVALLEAGGRPLALVAGIWAVLTLVLTLDLTLLRRRFCSKVCPYAKLQGVLFDDRTLVVAFDEARAGDCMKCAACVKACPMGVDIREGSQVECIHCAECVDACADRMQRRGLPSLVRYSYGSGLGERGSASGVRVPLLMTGIVSAAFLALLVLLLTTRPPFEASLRPQEPANALLTGSGAVAVPCVLSLRNLSRSDLDLVLSASSPSGTVLVSRTAFTVAEGAEPLRVTLTLVIRDVADPSRPIPVEVVFRSTASGFTVRESFTAIQRPRK